ncbi:MAG TPA: metal ABC transporter permease, partial [Actinomycetota bacterium]|nr:metal ABC transporter permease [Actinomycetota bacterium]
MSILLEPFGYEFFQRALIVATISGALCGLIGVYVVLRGMSYIGHGLSHAIFGGAVASYLAGVNVFVGAGLWGLVAALFINRVARRRSIGADAAIGAITSASFAIGIILISVQRTFVVNFEALLWGNVLGVAGTDVLVVLGVALATSAFVFLRYRQLLFATFDPEVAEVSGVRTARVDVLLAIALT